MSSSVKWFQKFGVALDAPEGLIGDENTPCSKCGWPQHNFGTSFSCSNCEGRLDPYKVAPEASLVDSDYSTSFSESHIPYFGSIDDIDIEFNLFTEDLTPTV